MEELQSHLEKARKSAFRVTAYVFARTFRRDLRMETDRFEQQPRAKSYLETGATLMALFGLSILAASFGWIGLALYFVAVLILFY